MRLYETEMMHAFKYQGNPGKSTEKLAMKTKLIGLRHSQIACTPPPMLSKYV